MITFKQFIDESTNDKGVLKAIFVVGIPGAGKTYTISQINGRIAPKLVTMDTAAEYLIKKLGIPSTDETWPKIVDTARKMTLGSLYSYVNGVLPLFVDGTLNDISNVQSRINILESIGYDIGMVYVHADLYTAKSRAVARAKVNGRHVSDDFIEKTHAVSEKNKELFMDRFTFYKEVDNSSGAMDNEALLKIYRAAQGFYSEPVKNARGQEVLEKLKSEKQGYLVPTIYQKEDLAEKLAGWYKGGRK